MGAYSFAAIFSSVLFLGSCCVRQGSKCPDYTVLKTFQDFEERLYPALVWVSASEAGSSKSEVSEVLITRLYGYLGGDNDKGKNLDMMVPVRTTKVPSTEGNSTYTMSIALTPDRQQDPPVPNSPMLTLRSEPATVYVTRSFGGMIRKEREWEEQAGVLRSAVADDDAVDASFYHMAVYDSPWRQEDRLNEVWMLKRGE